MQTTVATPVAVATEKRKSWALRFVKNYIHLINKLGDHEYTPIQILHFHHLVIAFIFTVSSVSLISLLLSFSWLLIAGILAKKGGAL